MAQFIKVSGTGHASYLKQLSAKFLSHEGNPATHSELETFRNLRDAQRSGGIGWHWQCGHLRRDQEEKTRFKRLMKNESIFMQKLRIQRLLETLPRLSGDIIYFTSADALALRAQFEAQP